MMNDFDESDMSDYEYEEAEDPCSESDFKKDDEHQINKDCIAACSEESYNGFWASSAPQSPFKQFNSQTPQAGPTAKFATEKDAFFALLSPGISFHFYSINPWMGGTVDKTLAMKQWEQLKLAIEKEGVKVLTLDQVKGLPDMVFSCNSGLVLGNKVYLSKFRHPERTGEQPHFAKWFKQNGFHVIGQEYPEFFEGGGDAVFSDYKTLWAGFGPRTLKEAYSSVSQLGEFDTVLCELRDSNFYHLDTCFCPVGAKSALWFPNAFSKETQDEILSRLPDAIAVSKEEANKFVCNAITIRNTVISPIGVTDATRHALKQLGYSVAEVDMSEFMKSGGACQCLVLKL